MGVLEWAREHLLATAAAALGLGILVTASALGVLAWIALALFVPGPQSTLGSLLPAFLVGVVAGVPLLFVATVGVAVGLLARASAAARGGSRRLQRVAGWIEHRSTLARVLGVSDLAAAADPRSPEERAADRVADLKDRYVDGEFDERTLERRVRDVLDEEGVGRESVSTVENPRRDGPPPGDERSRDRDRDRGRSRDRGRGNRPERERR